MSEQKEITLFERIREGIVEAQQEMIIRKAKLGEDVVIADENGQPLVLPAKDALHLYGIESID